MTLPTHHPYFFTCPSCGCKLISVSSGVRAKPHCPECDYFADDAFVVKDRVVNEAMNVIADNAELAENFAETVKNEIASDDDAYAHIGFHLANDIRNQSPASEVRLEHQHAARQDSAYRHQRITIAKKENKKCLIISTFPTLLR